MTRIGTAIGGIIVALILALSGHAYSSSLLTMGVSQTIAAGSLDPFAITFVTSHVDTACSTTCTHTTTSVGTDVTGSNVRYTIVGGGGGNSAARSVSSMTICGVAATEVTADKTTTFVSASIFYAITSGLGTTCTIAVTNSGSMLNGSIGVWEMINPASGTPTAAVCNNAFSSSSALSLNLNVSAGGAAVAFADGNRNTNRTYTWVGVTEDFDATVENTVTTHSGAHGTTSGTPLTLTVTPSATLDDFNGCAASWL